MEHLNTFIESHRSFALLRLPVVIIALALWSIAWKGFGLWYAARNHQKRWFISILILNTLGALEIIYLIWFRRDKQEGQTKSLFDDTLPTASGEPAVAQTVST